MQTTLGPTWMHDDICALSCSGMQAELKKIYHKVVTCKTCSVSHCIYTASVLLQKPQYQQKCQKGNITTQRHHQHNVCSIYIRIISSCCYFFQVHPENSQLKTRFRRRSYPLWGITADVLEIRVAE